jgi:DNA polymerase V
MELGGEDLLSVPTTTLKTIEHIYEQRCVVGVIVGPRVIDAGVSLLSVLISPVPVAAGFPSPAQDYFDGRIDLNEHLIIL